MSVRKLVSYLNAKDAHGVSAVQRTPLEALADARVGIDGLLWLQKYIFPLDESLSLAIGVQHFSTIRSKVDAQLDGFRNAGIEPIFVFPGLQSTRFKEDKRGASRISAWMALNSGRMAEGKMQLRDGIAMTNEIQNFVIQLLQDHHAQCFRAAYTVNGQLTWMEAPDQNYLHACFGTPDLLMHGVSRVILDFDFHNHHFKWVDRDALLENANLSSDQWFDVCAFAGFEHCHPFPALNEGQFEFEQAISLIQSFGSGDAAIQHYITAENDKEVQAFEPFFQKAKRRINHPRVLVHGAVLETWNALADVKTNLCPQAFFTLLSRNIVTSRVADAIEAHLWYDNSPLCGGNTLEFHRLLETLQAKNTFALNVFAATCSRSVAKPIVVSRWYDSSTPSKKTLTIDVAAADVLRSSTLLPDSSGALEVSSLLKTLAESKQNLLGGTENTVTAFQAAAVSAASTLKYLGYADTENVWSRALSKYTERSNDALLLLELLRDGLNVHGDLFTTLPLQRKALPPLKQNEIEINLISRVCSAMAATIDVAPWNGPVDHDLLRFNSLLRAEQSSLRNIVESCSVYLLHNYGVQSSVETTGLWARTLPFGEDRHTVMGILVKHSLQSNLEDVKTLFGQCIAVDADLKAARQFWLDTFSALTLLHEEQAIPSQLYDMYVSANEYAAARWL